MMNEEILYHLWLAEAFSYGSSAPMRIALSYDHISDFYCDADKAAHNPFLTQKNLEKLNSTKPEDYQGILEECERRHIKILCFSDATYPYRLREIDAAPIVLYYSGNLDCLSERCIAMVGTRNAGSYGVKTTERIASELAARGITVISGCANGIDQAAHRGAMEHGKTVAVLGTSLERDYPHDSKAIKRNIVHKGGLVLTEYPPGTKTGPWLFPVRNRIICGLSDAVAVMEAPKKSGALITANIAVKEQGKDVFCLPPADVYDPRYQGQVACLRDGATPLMSVQDLLNVYRFARPQQLQSVAFGEHLESSRKKSRAAKASTKAPKQESVPKKADISGLSEQAKKLYQLLEEQSPADINDLSEKLSCSVSSVLTAGTELELSGLVKKTGSLFFRA